MRKFVLTPLIVLSALVCSCEKDEIVDIEIIENIYGNGPRTNVPGSLQGNWMYGNFSMTEY